MRERARTLEFLRLTDSGYATALVADRSETVRAEPFEAMDLKVGVLFGDDPED